MTRRHINDDDEEEDKWKLLSWAVGSPSFRRALLVLTVILLPSSRDILHSKAETITKDDLASALSIQQTETVKEFDRLDRRIDKLTDRFEAHLDSRVTAKKTEKGVEHQTEDDP